MTTDMTPKSFEKLIPLLIPKIKRVAKKYLNDFRDVEEVAQDVSIRLTVLAKRGDFPRSIDHWINVAARNAAIDMLRKIKLKRELDDEGMSARLNTYEELEILEMQISARPIEKLEPDVRHAICEAFEKLPKIQQLMLKLIVAGVTYEQVAQASNLSLGTVKSTVHRARHFIRESVWRKLGDKEKSMGLASYS